MVTKRSHWPRPKPASIQKTKTAPTRSNTQNGRTVAGGRRSGWSVGGNASASVGPPRPLFSDREGYQSGAENECAGRQRKGDDPEGGSGRRAQRGAGGKETLGR